ncbi:urease accessory protein UreD [Pseudooceanicola onchidii]|uniref:urease accessory protein UreD n=1 Tax=Pseudooceanicola onchidii TaxID=2562279 RepID=UPI001F10AB3C|nr:urease accessory protein UreD [Pseudooceanicola onchidii]
MDIKDLATLPRGEMTARPAQPRARGRMLVSAKLRAGRSRISDLHQSGSLKALFPHGSSTALQAVMLNTAGGVTGGDQFALTAEAQAGAHLVLTTQAAERIYRAQPGEVGQVRTMLRVAAGARVDWLPQETILFDHCALDRRLEAEVAPDARLLVVEPLIFGRGAMGEVVHSGHFLDRWRINFGGELIFADNLMLSGDLQATLDRAAVAQGARAMASLLLVAPDADRYLDRLRAALGPSGGASVIRPGVLFARAVAVDGFALRRHIIPAIQALSGADIPKTWTL